ncbi:MAG: DUF362 domain-containing protein [Desulfobulbaceae bacterium]|nr:DUF362 domain-containing protein [Desulfobulbaceae bacterium]
MSGTVYMAKFVDWHQVGPLLSLAGLDRSLAQVGRVMIKPNLVADQPPPVTTPVSLVTEIIRFVRQSNPKIDIIVADGCGSLKYETSQVFSSQGYTAMAAAMAVSLLDLNSALPLRHLSSPRCRRWPEMYLPEILFDSFLISVPVLKAHSMAGVTLTMKNMMGAAPPAYYRQNGHWKKASFHENIQEAIFDLNQYRTPDFTLLDATVGMPEAHLWGPVCQPPIARLLAGSDPVAIDAYAAGLLGIDWRQIGHIVLADGCLGQAEPIGVREL